MSQRVNGRRNTELWQRADEVIPRGGIYFTRSARFAGKDVLNEEMRKAAEKTWQTLEEILDEEELERMAMTPEERERLQQQFPRSRETLRLQHHAVFVR